MQVSCRQKSDGEGPNASTTLNVTRIAGIIGAPAVSSGPAESEWTAARRKLADCVVLSVYAAMRKFLATD